MPLSINLVVLSSYLFIAPLVLAQETQPQETQTQQNKPQDPSSSQSADTPRTIDPSAETTRDGNLVIVSHPIFDESASNAFFLHRWANFLHINTRPSTITNALSFDKNQSVTQKDLDEAQRILREESYIRDAKVSFTQRKTDGQTDDEVGQDILVETWDNWSLLPTFSFGRSGGDNTVSMGIKEDNLLGYGIRTRLRYQSDADRNGYKLAFRIPTDSLIRHSTLTLDFYDNSDGQAAFVDFTKPFYTLDGENMYSTRYVTDSRVDIIRQNGNNINEFNHEVDYADLEYGWLFNKADDWRSRIVVGITRDNNQFENIDLFPSAPLPKDRDFLYPWISYQYLQDDYKVLNNIYLIGKNEDLNLGWQHYFKLGIETLDTQSNPVGYHLDWRTSRGYMSENHLLLLAIGGEGILATAQNDYFKLSTLAEYFYHISPKWTAYAKSRLSTSKNNFLDKTFALGDETGIRGFPNDYQHGNNQWLVSAELRHYPNINLYQLAELGWALFTDYGQASGGPDENNETKDPIGSFGVGARLFSSRSSYGSVAHIDFSVPFTAGDHVNSWEWRFQIKSHF
ncbi:hypothetical protein LZP69_13845 [Shewanella sp. AS1]|uniref:ShlB/FhaC/HecB family hemolysin secretion/activation protein n=1 Tax=Shewanella sp. AS1 TaxID=2907626 RepID=UPI001F1DE6B0|nr:ShlB/FhaC/HecB family hemolysin secretion/activation protein [Shewanella sp. AS1]MCE9680242.1 hypothetical protein [Shewanella sp. AS1]